MATLSAVFSSLPHSEPSNPTVLDHHRRISRFGRIFSSCFTWSTESMLLILSVTFHRFTDKDIHYSQQQMKLIENDVCKWDVEKWAVDRAKVFVARAQVLLVAKCLRIERVFLSVQVCTLINTHIQSKKLQCLISNS